MATDCTLPGMRLTVYRDDGVKCKARIAGPQTVHIDPFCEENGGYVPGFAYVASTRFQTAVTIWSSTETRASRQWIAKTERSG